MNFLHYLLFAANQINYTLFVLLCIEVSSKLLCQKLYPQEIIDKNLFVKDMLPSTHAFLVESDVYAREKHKEKDLEHC